MEAALKLLDEEIGEKQTLYICGGTAIALRFRARPTADVDVVEPEIFGHLLAAANRVAASKKGKEIGLASGWLNDHVGTMVKIAEVLPKNWKKRAEDSGALFRGRLLTVFSLHKLDLLRTKLLSSVSPDRGADALQDIKDIASLNLSDTDIYAEAKWLMKADQHYVPNTDKKIGFYEKFINEIVIDRLKDT